MDAWLVSYLGEYPRAFVHCTDDDAYDHLERSLQIAGIDLFAPATNIRDTVLKAITIPDNVGDSHIRAMLEQPDKYGVDKNVVETAIKSFYRLLWSGAGGEQLRLEVIAGHRDPQALLEVHTGKECTDK